VIAPSDDRPVVAIVGARRAGPAARVFARGLASTLARAGATIVSGMAHGVDAAAHEGALDAGGATVAVLGCGPDVAYPRRNRVLLQRVVSQGAICSEYWPGTRPAPWRFPARNRIVAGLAHATVVVEAGARSGALITADFALEHGRAVLAVPGAPWSAASEGCNELIRHGATLCARAEDVVDELSGLEWGEIAPARPEIPEGDAAAVHAALAEGPRTPDELAERLGMASARVLAAVGALEVLGAVVVAEGRVVAA
jgi:DNA processing protein